MSKDYKRQWEQSQQKERRDSSGVPGWQWMLAAVAVLGFVGFLVHLRSKSNTPPPAPPSYTPITLPGKGAAPAVDAGKVSTAAPTDDAQRAAAPAAAADKPPAEDAKPSKPRFQFYTVLEGKEVTLPETEVKARKQEESQGTAPKGEAYMLQIASFRTPFEAERLKVQLAALSVDARLEVAQIGAATWNRVKVGPFASLAALEKTRNLLRQNGIDSIVQKAAPVGSAPRSTP